MIFPDIKQRKPDCDISINAQVTAANFKAKKYSIKEGWQKLSLETLGSVSDWENMNSKKNMTLFLHNFQSSQENPMEFKENIHLSINSSISKAEM